MALITCPECGKEISDTSKVCVHCGYKIKKKMQLNDKFIGTSAIVCILIVALIYTLVSGFTDKNKKPENMSEAVYNIGIQILEVTDEFIDGKIDLREAKDSLDELYERVNDREQSVYDSGVATSTLGIQIDLTGYSIGHTNITDIIESRNKLAEKLNCPTREN